MKCLICKSDMALYLSKNFNSNSLSHVEYFICSNCGMVISKTHFDLSDPKWQELNKQYHSGFFETNTNIDDPKWLQRLEDQENAIMRLATFGIIPKDKPWVDWGWGDGKLSNFFQCMGYRF